MAKLSRTQAGSSSDESTASGGEPRVFFIPARISTLPITHLPLSPALSGVLSRMGVVTLGNLHGLAVKEFQRIAEGSAELASELAGLIVRASQGAFRTAGLAKGRLGATPRRRYLPSESLLLPTAVHNTALARLRLSTALRHLVKAQGLKLLGQLHGRTLGALTEARGGDGSIRRELIRLVYQMQGEVRVCPAAALAKTGVAGEVMPSLPEASRAGRRSEAPAPFKLPPAAQAIPVSEVPLSTRLAAAFERRGIRHLGDLNGRSLADFQGLSNCGRETLRELAKLVDRAVAGEFAVSPAALRRLRLADLPALIDGLVADLPARSRTMLVWRFGGAEEKFWTLQAIGAHFGLTRERVRQVVQGMIPTLRRHGGVRLSHLAKRVADECLGAVCPLTPELVEHWLASRRARPRFALPFYVGLLGALNPNLPAWPTLRPSARILQGSAKNIVDMVKNRLQAEGRPLSFKRAYELTKAGIGNPNLAVNEFLAALKDAKRLHFDLRTPTHPKVQLRKANATAES